MNHQLRFIILQKVIQIVKSIAATLHSGSNINHIVNTIVRLRITSKKILTDIAEIFHSKVRDSMSFISITPKFKQLKMYLFVKKSRLCKGTMIQKNTHYCVRNLLKKSGSTKIICLKRFCYQSVMIIFMLTKMITNCLKSRKSRSNQRHLYFTAKIKFVLKLVDISHFTMLIFFSRQTR